MLLKQKKNRGSVGWKAGCWKEKAAQLMKAAGTDSNIWRIKSGFMQEAMAKAGMQGQGGAAPEQEEARSLYH